VPHYIAIDGLLLDTHRLALALAVLAAIELMRFLARVFSVPPHAVERIGMLVMLCGAIAARATFAATHWAAYRDAPWTVLYFWRGGYNAPAGVLVATAVAAIVLGILHVRRAGAYALPVVLGLVGPAALLAAFLSYPIASQGGPRLALGDTAPALHMEDLHGNPVSLGSYRGHPVVLNVWATWCTPCREEIPILARAFSDHRAQGLRVIGADRGEPRGRIVAFRASTRMPYPTWIDPETSHAQTAPSAKLLDLIGAPGLPATLFIDADGTVRAIHVGQLHRDSLIRGLERILPDVKATASPTRQPGTAAQPIGQGGSSNSAANDSY